MSKEQWEIDLRAKLNNELPEGFRILGEGRYKFGTGKQGEIEFRVKEQMYIRGLMGVEPLLHEKCNNNLDSATEDDFLDVMKLLLNKRDENGIE